MTNIAASVDVRSPESGKARLWSFVGPAALISIGYTDPGLLWVLLASSLIAILLRSLAAGLGIGSRRDPAQACAEHYSRPIAWVLSGLAEIAVVACDLAQVPGAAIALRLLFGIPIVWGAVIIGFDVLLVLGLQTFGVPRLEAVITVLVATIGYSVRLF